MLLIQNWIYRSLFAFFVYIGLDGADGGGGQYRPAYLEHFEKMEQQNQRNLVNNQRVDQKILKGDPVVGGGQPLPGKGGFLGPIDFEFVSTFSLWA